MQKYLKIIAEKFAYVAKNVYLCNVKWKGN